MPADEDIIRDLRTVTLKCRALNLSSATHPRKVIYSSVSAARRSADGNQVK